jgi:hypothetical protein
VAAWLSETVLRGRGPGASEFESHRMRRIFSKEGTSAGLMVGWWKEARHSSDHHPKVGRVQIPAVCAHGCRVVFVLCRPERRKERRGCAWVTGESAPELRRTTKEKRGEKEEKTISRPQGT